MELIQFTPRRIIARLSAGIDGALLMIAVALVALGLATLYSASYDLPARVTGQAMNLLVAFGLMWVMAQIMRFGQNDKVFARATTPAGRDGDAVFFVKRMTELAGEEFLGLRVVVHARAENRSILIHFPPLLTTFRTKGQ